MAEALDEFPERFGPFILLDLLGAGGMGSAYLALHAESDALLVVKRMHKELLSEKTLFKRFLHEAEVASHVRHPNVAALVAMGSVDREPFMATEFVFGIQVSTIVDRVEERLIDLIPLAVALKISIDLAKGLEAIHGATHRDSSVHLGLIHRDIGARNVLIGFDGVARLIDLGLGKSILADWQTAHEMLAGSPDYMPPEQAMGTEVDARADVYSAAVTIWELIAGRKRIREESIAARLTRAIGAQPEPLLKYRPEASKRLEAILKNAMSPTLETRTATANQLVRTLQEELNALSRAERSVDTVAWLDAACATIIAREKRQLEEIRATAASMLRPKKRAHTKFFVRAPDGPLAQDSVYEFYAADHPKLDAPVASRKVPATRGLRLPSLLSTLDPEVFKAATPARRIAVIASCLAVMFLITGVTVFVLRPSDAVVSATALPPSSRSTAKAAPPPAVDSSTPPRTSVSPLPPPQTDVPPRKARVAPPPPLRRSITPMSVKAKSKRAQLLGRIRRLRRVSFDVEFQRRLTRISTRLSQERTEAGLRRLEAELEELNSEP